ncbi:MAG: hypothetical protein U1F43_07090 [Myxococcota bacterium]
MAMLDKGASGAMHLQWGKLISATMKAHEQHNYLLSDGLRATVARERAALEKVLGELGVSVGAYRAFVEGAFIEIRANQRVADYLVDRGQVAAKSAVSVVKADVDAVLPGGAVSIWSGKPISRILRAGRVATVDAAEKAAAKVRSLPVRDLFAFREPIALALEKAASLLDGFVAHERDVIEPQRLPLRSTVEGRVFALREFLVKMNARIIQDGDQAFVDSLYPDLRRDQKGLAEPVDDTGEASAEETSPEVAPA